MKIIAMNAGSSSFKYQLFEMPEEKMICSGIAEKIGLEKGIFSLKINGEKYEEEFPIKDHEQAIDVMLEWLLKYNAVSDLSEITGAGHRVVHGGEYYSKSVVIDDEVEARIQELSEFAPLHNPANLKGIQVLQKALPNIKSVAVFDTAFHQTMPEEVYMYATPYEWYDEYRVRKYGFHGTSHEFVSQEAARLVGKPYEETKTIVLHLGNGASLCAVKNGKSFNTTMGFTPLAGIPMGTRSGDIDPAIVPFIVEKYNISSQEVIDQLNKESGFAGVSGVSSDARDLIAAADAGDVRAQLAIDIYARRIAEAIGSYIVSLEGVDIIAFTAGIGENAAKIRKPILDRLAGIGIAYDETINAKTIGDETILSTDSSTCKVAVIPTNEELVIARDTFALI